MNAEYNLGNYTPKGWILKKAEDAYNATRAEIRDFSMAISLDKNAFEKAIYAAIDAAIEVGLVKAQ
jgi:hypothetical protein